MTEALLKRVNFILRKNMLDHSEFLFIIFKTH